MKLPFYNGYQPLSLLDIINQMNMARGRSIALQYDRLVIGEYYEMVLTAFQMRLGELSELLDHERGLQKAPLRWFQAGFASVISMLVALFHPLQTELASITVRGSAIVKIVSALLAIVGGLVTLYSFAVEILPRILALLSERLSHFARGAGH
ncbi:MAG: hypothetical protein IPK19_16510 [Chloroflexi bacterium]|nr:hypothetical protein [Chloroflexota bacterium]